MPATPTLPTARNLIDGVFTAAGADGIPMYDPATGEVIGHAPRGTRADIDAAVAAAKRAFPAWAATPAPKRAEILFRAARVMEERKDELARLVTREMGKVKLEAEGDVQEAIDMAYYMAGEGRRLFGATTPSELPNKFCLTLREPIGVCGLITPWNFPVAIPSWKSLPALVCGNTVVIKPSEETGGCATAYVECLMQAGLPPGVVNIVHGTGEVAGDALVRHPDVPVLSMTGSNETGRLVAQNAAPMLKHLHVELGGKNGIIVLDDADLDFAVQAILWSAYGTSGQRCTAGSRIIVQAGVHDALLEKLVAAAKTQRVGHGWSDDVNLGPVVRPAALEKIERYVKIGVEEDGATLACGGRRADVPAELAGGWYFEPTVFCDVTPTMRIAQEEIFGPVTALIRVQDLDEAIEVFNGTPYGLSGAIITRDFASMMKGMRALKSGIVYLHNGTIGAEVHLPFGGVKATGNGHREAGIAGIDFYSELKTVYIDYSGALQRAQID
ncbi:MAG: aldehyde dehydrogenase family protein [Planctomycetota bacterium]|nr:aldehyde dehydrogenase family protein [Planctomycetota bacterium]